MEQPGCSVLGSLSQGEVGRTASRAPPEAGDLCVPSGPAMETPGGSVLRSLSRGAEICLVALGIGMAACGTVLLSAIPSAAFSYMSVVLLPSALKYFLVGQKGYLLLGTLALSYWGCLAALIARTSRDNRELQESELVLAERNTQLELASKSARVASFSVHFST